MIHPGFSYVREKENVKMPYKPKVLCKHPGCPELVDVGKGYCEKHKPLHPEYTRSAAKRGYNSKWQRVRKRYLEAHPLCVMCMAENPPRYEKATVVDHKIPHRGDQKLFWDESNWQPLCKRHHDLKTGNEDSNPEYKY